MRKSLTCVLALVLVGMVTVVAADARDHYKIGVITSLSGALATGGNITKQGYDLWAATINAAGGIDIRGKRYTVKLVYADAQSEPSQAASAAERLATQEKVDCVLGPYSSGVTLASAPVLEKYQVPMITGSAESPQIWKQKFRYTFGTIPPANFIAGGALETISGLSPTPKTAVIIGSNDTFSKATAEAMRDVARARGIKVLKYNIVPSGQDLTPYLSAVRALRPDVIGFGGHDEELIRLVKVLRQINYAPKALLMHYGVTEPAFREALGDDAEMVYGATVWTPSTHTHGELLWKDAAEYAAAAQQAYGVTADYTMAGCSAAGIAFQRALQQTQLAPPLAEADRLALVEALEKLDIQTFYGPVNFGTEGQYYHANIGLTPLTVQIQKGAYKVVGPEAYKEADAIYPMTPWKQR